MSAARRPAAESAADPGHDAPATGTPAAPAAPDARTAAMVALFDEMRALVLLMPGRRVPPEADEADFDNMPV